MASTGIKLENQTLTTSDSVITAYLKPWKNVSKSACSLETKGSILVLSPTAEVEDNIEAMDVTNISDPAMILKLRLQA